MSAMKISSENKLEYFHALVTLHTAHVQVGYFSLILNHTHTSFDREREVTISQDPKNDIQLFAKVCTRLVHTLL